MHRQPHIALHVDHVVCPVERIDDAARVGLEATFVFLSKLAQIHVSTGSSNFLRRNVAALCGCVED